MDREAHVKDEAANRHDQPSSDSTTDEQIEQKKIEEPVTYVVQVGDQEDLDYDLKSENDVSVECNSTTQGPLKDSTDPPNTDESPERFVESQEFTLRTSMTNEFYF